MENYKRALFASVTTIILLPIIVFVVYLSNQGRLSHPNTVDILSFALYYLCTVPGTLVFAVFYYKRRFRIRGK
jgi:hypothetical protein